VVRVLVLFVDGVGVGPDDPATNPLATAELPNMARLLFGRRPVQQSSAGPAERGPLFPLDACLGVPGLPQSATGQTALLTGINAAARLGRHLGPYPNATLRELLAAGSLWRRLAAAGRRTAYANAFPDRYLDGVRDGRGRMGAIARAALLAGVRLRGPEDLRQGAAVSAFLTNAGWRERLGDEGIPDIDEAEAGARLARLVAQHDFTLFEHYATDMAGHAGDLAAGRSAMGQLDRFLGGVLAEWRPADLLLVVSDHGNLEDTSTKRHTRNPALGIWWGPSPRRRLAALTDVAPAITDLLGAGSSDAADDGSTEAV
jgi:hypothetical protein